MWRDYAHRLEAYMVEQQAKNDAKFAELEAKNEALSRAFERRSEQRAKMPPPPKPCWVSPSSVIRDEARPGLRAPAS